jgi:hypothetical protein
LWYRGGLRFGGAKAFRIFGASFKKRTQNHEYKIRYKSEYLFRAPLIALEGDRASEGTLMLSGVPRGVQTPPKFRSFDKAEPNSLFCGKYICNNLIRIWVSLICKLSGTPD